MQRTRLGWLLLLCGLAAFALSAQSEEEPKATSGANFKLGEPNTLPEGDKGIAAKYTGDAGIDKDPKVLFADNFEEVTTEELRARKGKWDSINGAQDKTGTSKISAVNVYVVSSSDADQHVASGKRSLNIIQRTNKDQGGGLFKRFKGADTVHARFYIRFAEDFQKISHFVWLMAEKGDPKYPVVKAGAKPDGATRFSTALEPLCWKASWAEQAPIWHFYSYFHKMKGNYGQDFSPKPKCMLDLGKWMCMEFMLKANSAPDKDDGEHAFWKDGKLVGHWTGIHWRSTNDLKVSGLHLNAYRGIDANKQANSPYVESRLWFDDVVVATEYIGPRK